MNKPKTQPNPASALFVGSALLFASFASGQTHYVEFSNEERNTAAFPERFDEVVQTIEAFGGAFEGAAIFSEPPRAVPPGDLVTALFAILDASEADELETLVEELESLDAVKAVFDSEEAIASTQDRNLFESDSFGPDEDIPARKFHGLRVKERPHQPSVDTWRFANQLLVFYLEPLPGDTSAGSPAFSPEIVAIKEALGLRKVAPQEGTLEGLIAAPDRLFHEIGSPYEEALELAGLEEDNRSLLLTALTLLNQSPGVWRATIRDIFPPPNRPDVLLEPEEMVMPPPIPGESVRLGNASLRSLVGSGEALAISGFVIEGEEPKRAMLRARGPSLAEFGIENPVSDPYLRLFLEQNQIASNDDWTALSEGDRAEIEALGMAPGDDAESAWIGDLEPGIYTAHLRESPEAKDPVEDGVGIVEVFEVGGGEAQRFANLSSRAFVDAGELVAITGLIVEGTDPRRFVLRAKGPSLAAFGVEEPLEDPVVALFKGQTLLATNDDWRDFDGDYTLIETFLEDAGLALEDVRESVIVADLEPGAYTLVARGKDGGAGVVLVEAFEL